MQNRKNNYFPLVIPINKPFDKLTKDEAKDYFEWFVSHVDERANYIRQLASEDLCIPIDILDYSPESLIVLWRWFLNVAEISKTPSKVLKSIRQELKANNEPKEFIEDMIREHRAELSIFTKYLIRDIGMYVGKTLIMNNESLRWDYHTNTKKDSFANIPQLFGVFHTDYNPPFEMLFDPLHFTEMQASNLLYDTQNEDDLYNVYKRWEKWIPQNN